jgi:hypothetical protein
MPSGLRRIEVPAFPDCRFRLLRPAPCIRESLENCGSRGRSLDPDARAEADAASFYCCHFSSHSLDDEFESSLVTKRLQAQVFEEKDLLLVIRVRQRYQAPNSDKHKSWEDFNI